ncbi:MAG: nickel/cobalt transporter [Hyphomicrobiaceae bacterium]|nr:MAG: nickel/cobalt transporter [Hyphomicrobiaceae bacterium]
MSRRVRSFSSLLALILVVLAAIAGAEAQAQTQPAQRPAPTLSRTAAVPSQGWWGDTLQWINAKQLELRRQLQQAVQRMKTGDVLGGAAVLGFVSFLYGVLHAVGPGHGKAIISSYVVANGETARRGVLLAFISSAFQAISAILLVGGLFLIFGKLLQRQLKVWEDYLEVGSYGLIALLGAWLLFSQIRARYFSKNAHPHHQGHAHHDHVHAHEHAHSHGHDHQHHLKPGETCDHCGHQHLPTPDQLKGKWSWKRALALSFAVGIRPCTGALIVLGLAMSQGLYLAGISATFAMALGTAITVSLLAVLSVTARDLAARLAGQGSVWSERIYAAAGIGGSALILLMGLTLLAAALQTPARPF